MVIWEGFGIVWSIIFLMIGCIIGTLYIISGLQNRYYERRYKYGRTSARNRRNTI